MGKETLDDLLKEATHFMQLNDSQREVIFANVDTLEIALMDLDSLVASTLASEEDKIIYDNIKARVHSSFNKILKITGFQLVSKNE